MPAEQISDEELVARWRAGADSPASDPHVNELFRRYHERVACWCLRFTRDREAAADLAQDTFVSAYRKLSSFRCESKFSTWLYAIARNRCINEIRARSQRPEAAAEPLLLDLPDGGGIDPRAALQREDAVAAMRQLLSDSLDEVERKVFALHYGEDLPLAAITRLLGLNNASGAKAYIVSARRKLERAVQRLKVRERARSGGRHD